MSAATAGRTSAIRAAIPRRSFRTTAPVMMNIERAVCSDSPWNAVADSPQQCVAFAPAPSRGAGRLGSELSRTKHKPSIARLT
jgi:hypothetical protein